MWYQEEEEEPDTSTSLVRVALKPAQNMPPSGTAQPQESCCDVFISSAAAEKDAIALPLLDHLKLCDLSAVLGVDESLDTLSMHHAIESTRVAVVVLTLQFAVEQRPIRELLALLHRCEDAHRRGLGAPTIIPVFFGLAREECSDKTLFRRCDAEGKNVFAESGFFERVLSGEADLCAVFKALSSVAKHVGIANDKQVTIEDSEEMVVKRHRFLQLVVEHVLMSVDRYLDEANLETLFQRAVAFEDASGGVERDLPKAVALYERVVQASQRTDAMARLGSLLMLKRLGVKRDPEKAVVLLERAIREGNETRAMNGLGVLLCLEAEYGGTVEQDYERAVQLFRRAIDESGCVRAMNNLAFSYEKGEGVAKDAVRAVELYERAVREGPYPYACSNLGRILEEGAPGVRKDPKRSVALYEQAIACGGKFLGATGMRQDVLAMYWLAWFLERGADGVEKDEARAATLYENAIQEEAYIPAMHDLAKMLAEGRPGVERDDQKAMRLFERAVEEGNDMMSMHNLGVLLWCSKDDATHDPSRAMSLFERAIRTGQYPGSMFRLGEILRQGAVGVPQDRARALKLFTRAWEEGKIEEARKARDEMLAES